MLTSSVKLPAQFLELKYYPVNIKDALVMNRTRKIVAWKKQKSCNNQKKIIYEDVRITYHKSILLKINKFAFLKKPQTSSLIQISRYRSPPETVTSAIR